MKKAEYKDLLIIYFKISVGVVQMICVCRDGDVVDIMPHFPHLPDEKLPQVRCICCIAYTILVLSGIRISGRCALCFNFILKIFICVL